MTNSERIQRINVVLEEFFSNKYNPPKIKAKDLMPLFIEKGILDTLSKMGVEVIDASGKFNPEVHQAILAEDNPDYESGDIIKEAYKGFIYKGKVIRYSQVIVKK